MEVEGGSKKKQITKKRRDIDIEKANQLIKKSKTHSNKEAAESADKEVVVVSEKSSNDDDDDDDVVKLRTIKFVYGTKKNLKKYEKTEHLPEVYLKRNL
ncbi:unnamed protein product [Rhizophagus irregularis]|nr:unnamed protein product [Rhizophagus irregularis]